MSLENEDRRTLDQHAETNCESKKQLKFSYTRDFLLSLKGLDDCKNLPSRFDQSILSEFEDTSQDRPKNSGSLSLHGYRRNEYGSSPPTRGELGNYSRGIHGRWDSRSSGRSDRDSDSQSDWDSDSGRRCGNQSRRSFQVPEHDGLLGSGSFTRPSGYAAGASAPKFRTNDHYQLNRSNEPYQPPRPYKAAHHSRRDTNDSFNDETFGYSECTSEDRAEEERKRRDSFELMRKEQQKSFQEKQKVNPDKRKDEFDITTLLDDSKDDKGISSESKQVDEPVLLPATNKDSDKSVLLAQAPASRPLVPPGFANATLERNHGTKMISHSHSSEVGNSELASGILQTKGSCLLNGTFDEQKKESAEKIGLSSHLERKNIHVSANNKSDKVHNLTSDLEFSNKTIGPDSHLYKNSNLLKAFEASEGSEGIELDAEKVAGNKIVGESNQDQPTSFLDKLFDSVLTVNSGSSTSVVEQHEVKVDDLWSPHAVQSSKFARWFLEEEKKPVDISSGRPNDVLSLIVGGEKGGFQPPDVKSEGHNSFGFPSQSSELVDRHLASNVTPVMIENSEQLPDTNINKSSAVPVVLTCEDLEQSILSEISGSDETLQPPVQGWSVSDAKTEQTEENTDDHASQHLLSLLQKGISLKDVAPSPGLDVLSSDKPHNVEVTSIPTGVNDSREANEDNVLKSGKSLTLETLFGTAFMKELQSVGTLSSAQKGSVGSARIGASELHDGLPSSKLDIGSGRISYESNSQGSNHIEQFKSDWMKEHLLGFDDCRTEVEVSHLRSEVESKLGGLERSVDSRFPEEGSLITLGDPMKHLRIFSKAELLSSSAAPVDISEKLAALNSTFGDERSIITGSQDGSPFLRGPYDVRECDISFHNVLAQPSPPQLHPQLNHVGPLVNPLDSHPANMNSQMKFMAPESITHHHPQPVRQFPANTHRPPFIHPSTGLTGFDAPTHHHPMLPQMHMPGSFPPPHLSCGFPRGPHSSNQMADFIQDMNPMQGFSTVNWQPNFIGLGMSRMPPPVTEVEGRTNNPDTLQRLIEMELRSNPKQIYPAHNQGMYNHELDTGFGYR